METLEQQDSQELLADFVDEAIDSLRSLAEQLQAFQLDPSNSEPIHGVFRAVHSIKGCAGFLGLTAIKNFSHALENQLDEIRNGQVALSDGLRQRLVQSFDMLETFLHLAGEGEEVVLDDDAQVLLDQIRDLANGSRKSTSDNPWQRMAELAKAWRTSSIAIEAECGRQLESLLAQTPAAAPTGKPAACQSAESASAASGSQPRHCVNGRFQCGSLDATGRVVSLAQSFIRWETQPCDQAEGDAFLKELASLVELAEQAGDPSIAAALGEAANDFRTVHASPLDFDATLLSLVWEQLSPALDRLRAAKAAPPSPATETATEVATTAPISAPGDPAASGKRPEANDKKSQPSSSRQLRIREENLDEFLEHVSGLFITGELLKDLQRRLSQRHERDEMVDELRQLNTAFMRQSTSLQKSVIALRRIAASTLLAKFPRMARNLAGELGKQLDVQLSGEQLEIDKNLLEALDAPLTHMVRNVVDHAIEMPHDRERVGKAPAGKLWLKVEQHRSRVRIIIQDDGRGLDPAALKRKAVEKGLLTRIAADAMADDDARELIFAPGFSTAQQVSEISGRGVGMDVVRTTLDGLGGRISVHSQVGTGTSFIMDVPLRDAVLVVDGLLLQHGQQSFVVPFEHIREITAIRADEVRPVHGAGVIEIRGRIYDAVRLDQALQLPSTSDSLPSYGLVVGCREGQTCLLVDQVIGHRQAVINSLQGTQCAVESIAGVAQLGGGRLALVLSVPDVVKRLKEGPGDSPRAISG